MLRNKSGTLPSIVKPPIKDTPKEDKPSSKGQAKKVLMYTHSIENLNRGGGSTARLGGRELTLLCGFHQYTLLQSRDNSGLLGTLVYYSLKLGGGGGHPPLWSPPWKTTSERGQPLYKGQKRLVPRCPLYMHTTNTNS